MARTAYGDAASDLDWEEGAGEGLGWEVFQPYRCGSTSQGRPHPGDIAEPASLAAIPLPHNDYPLDALPAQLIGSGALSSLQLEGMRYACLRHLSWLPTGERGFPGGLEGGGGGVVCEASDSNGAWAVVKLCIPASCTALKAPGCLGAPRRRA